VALVLWVEIGITIGLGSYWVATSHRQVRALIHRGARSRRSSRFAAALPEPPDHGARLAFRLGKFRVVSVVPLDQTAIVACRPCDRQPRRWLVRARFGRRSQTLGPWLVRTDQTVVLGVADAAEAERAWALLDEWRRAGTVLWLRPTGLPSTVKLSDDRTSTLQAELSSD
jgi:hypothetical protein